MDTTESFLRQQRRALGRSRPSPRLERFLPSERAMRLAPFDPSLDAWPLAPASRKFRDALAAHAADVTPRKELVVLFHFRRWRKGGERGQSPRQIMPVAFDPAARVFRRAGAPRINDALPSGAAFVAAEAVASDEVPPGTAYAVLLAASRDPLAGALDVERHPCIRDARALLRLAGGACAVPEPRAPCPGPASDPAWAVPLDPDQAAAARAVLGGADAALIGPPGAGKTQWIVAVAAAAPPPWRIACASPEGSALDALRERLARFAPAATVVVASPAEVAASTTPDRPFDLLIVDEAGRLGLPTGAALAALARQVVAIGDPAQLGPAEGGPSLLGRALACGFARFVLPWHYRSAEGRLIAPSSFLSYGQFLRAVPSPDRSGLQGLTLVEHRRPSIVRADDRHVNATEADAVVDSLARLAPLADGWSFGVVTFQPAQAEEIRRRVDRAVASGRIPREALAHRPDEPFFVRHAREIQGVERDVILVSFGFAARDGAPITRFGALDGAFPLETMNVALTRARRRCEVHTSFSLADLGTAPLSRPAFVIGSALKALRLCTRVPNRLAVDGWLEAYARNRGLGVEHLGVVQGLFAEGESRYRAGVVLHEPMHDAERWSAIAAQLAARGWTILEVEAPSVGALQDAERARLERDLDLRCGTAPGPH